MYVGGWLPQPPALWGTRAHLTVVALHVVISVHGHHTDGCLTALEEETGCEANYVVGTHLHVLLSWGLCFHTRVSTDTGASMGPEQALVGAHRWMYVCRRLPPTPAADSMRTC